MKKLIFASFMCLALSACCGNTTTRAVSEDSTSVDSVEVVDSSLIDTISFDSIN